MRRLPSDAADAVGTSGEGVFRLVVRGLVFAVLLLPLFGPAAASLQINLLPDQQGLLLAILPPGAFIGLAVLIALRKRYLQRTGAAEKVRQLT